MSMPTGSDPIDRLHAADPVRADDVPDASLARVTARVQEHIMSDKRFDPKVPPTRGPLAWAGGLALVGVVALAIVFGTGILGGQGSTPVAVVPSPSENPAAPSENPAAGGGTASCLVYDPANLPTFDIVFDGTVTAVDGDQVTFKVNTAWKGVGDTVTLTVPETNIAITGPMPEFKVDGRYLVTAFGSTINSCGYTLDYDAATAATWAAAFAAS
jgi:hypothetical protein